MAAASLCSNCGVAAESTCAKCHAAVYCGRECQSAHWKAGHKFFCSPKVEVKDIVGKGTGLFARRDFAVGDELSREKPILIQPGVMPNVTIAAASAQAAFSALPQVKLDVVMSLSNAWADTGISSRFGISTFVPLGITKTNGIPLGQNATHSGLYALACRMNHACKPNARYVWRPDLKRELVFATRPIRAGDEITVTYLAEYAPRAARKLRLLEEFLFECKCSACEDPARDLNAQEQSDARMLEIQELIDNVPTVGYTDQQRALRMCERVLQLQGKEKVDTPVDTHRIHYDAYQMAAASGNRRKATHHIRAACEDAKLCQGKDSPIARKYAGKQFY